MLVRATPRDDRWFLPVEDVERTAEAAGLAGIPPPEALGGLVLWLALAGASFLVALVLVRGVGRRPSEDSPLAAD